MSTDVLSSLARFSRAPEILSDILHEECNLAIWERDPIPAAMELLDAELHDVRFCTPIAVLAERLHDNLDAAGFPPSSARDTVATDIVQLGERYASILDLSEIEVRLEIVTTNSCRKFHADYVLARLITTYVGSGTDWLQDDQARRVKQGEEPESIERLKAGDVGLFKGKLGTLSPAIHRSPPIAGTGEKRLLLVLNPPEAL